MVRFQFNESKAVEALVYIAQRWPGITPFYLSKVLFFSDRNHLREYGRPVIGDIYVCPEVARVNARRFGTPFKREIERLIVHGSLHVVGYEHPEDDSRAKSPMWKKQERILARSR